MSQLCVPSLVVAIPTYRRNRQLAELLPDVVAQLRSTCTPGRARLIVVDNDPGQGAKAVVESLGLAEVHYAHEPRPGIAAARNRAVSESRAARILVFLDDDERPGQDWLAALLRTWCDTRADAVAGRVIPVFERTPSRWIVAGGFFERRSLPTGTVIPTAPAGNLLLDLQAVRERGLRFDERLGLSGGEDTRFTSELNATGGRIVFCRESTVEDVVPAERSTARWVLRRAFSHGNTTAVLAVESARPGQRSLARVRVGAGGLARMILGAGRTTYGVLSRDLRHQARGARLAARGLGISAGAGGRRYEEYARAWSGGDDAPEALSGSARRKKPARIVATRSRMVARARRVPGPVTSLMRVSTACPLIALTFDDGPDEIMTPQLLQVLQRHGAQATFFVLVQRARAQPVLLRTLIESGHEVALHGLDHRRLTTLPHRAALRSIESARDELEGLTGAPVRWYRPAYGAQSARLAWGVHRLGLRPVLWSATTWDWKDVPHTERLARCELARPGDIVLAHDGRAGQSDGAVEPADAVVVNLDKAALLDAALTAWSQRGLRIVSVAALLASGRPVWEARFSR